MGGFGERTQRAPRRCWGVTDGKVRVARGPERRGRRGCVFLWRAAIFWAVRERECVGVLEAGLGEWFVKGVEDWVEGSVGSFAAVLWW